MWPTPESPSGLGKSSAVLLSHKCGGDCSFWHCSFWVTFWFLAESRPLFLSVGNSDCDWREWVRVNAEEVFRGEGLAKAKVSDARKSRKKVILGSRQTSLLLFAARKTHGALRAFTRPLSSRDSWREVGGGKRVYFVRDFTEEARFQTHLQPHLPSPAIPNLEDSE